MRRSRPFTIGAYVLLILIFLFLIFPFLWVIDSSVRFEQNLFSGKFLENVGGLTLQHYKSVLSAGASGQFRVYFTNSLIIAVSSTVVVMLLSLVGAYALSRFKLRGKNGILLTILSSNMFPHVLLSVGIFGILFDFHLVDSYIGIILTHIILGLPFGLWLVKGYFDALPIDLDEAARLDGVGSLGILFKILVPIAAPGMVVAGFYAFMVSWGDFLFVSIISQSLETQTLTIGLNKFFGSTQVQWGPINAATVVTIAPTIVIFGLLQKYIVSGLASGAVKG